jgi:hypothetical protein
MRPLILACLLASFTAFSPALARAEEKLPPPPAADLAAAPRQPMFGLNVDLGVPEGGTIGVLYRPVRPLRIWAGPAWNYLAFGLQGGVALVPWHWAVSPALSIEGGHYFGADVTRVFTDVPKDAKPLLKSVGYDYVAGHLGAEFGSQRGFSFSLRLGFAYLRASAKGTNAGTDVSFSDPKLRATLPSVKLGFQYFF